MSDVSSHSLLMQELNSSSMFCWTSPLIHFFVALRFYEETTVLESYEVVCLMHAPARRPSTDHTCLLDIKAFGYYGISIALQGRVSSQ